MAILARLNMLIFNMVMSQCVDYYFKLENKFDVRKIVLGPPQVLVNNPLVHDGSP